MMQIHHRYTLAMLVLVLLGLGHPVQAEPLTPEQAVVQALAHNPQLAAVRQQAEANSAQRRAAQGGRLPQLDLNYVVRRSDNPLDAFADTLNTRSVTAADLDPVLLNDPDPSTLHSTQLSLQWPLYTGGKLSAQIHGAQANEQAGHYQLARYRQYTVFNTLNAYLQLQAAQRGYTIADDAVSAAQRHARTTGRLLRQGRIITSDKLTADVNLATLQAMREKAKSRVQFAHNQLKQVLGLDLQQHIEVLDWRDARNSYTPSDLGTLQQLALRQRLDLQAQKAQLTGAKAHVDVARAQHKPQLSLVASSNWYDEEFGTDSHSWSVMGVASINLFAGGRTQQQINAKQALAEQNRSQVTGLRLQIQTEVDNTYRRWQEAKTRLEITGDHVAKAQRTTKLVDQRYGQGRTLLIDLLQAERALVQTRQEALSAALDYEIGILAVQLASGELEAKP